ncbi:TPA: hypothetical protein N0F65_011232, partial [Lagenidium giganteum]
MQLYCIFVPCGGKAWRSIKGTLAVGSNLAILLLLFGLDVRDLLFKTRWVGPRDEFHFQAVGEDRLINTPLAPAFDLSRLRSGDAMALASGWGSFLERCTELYPLGPSGFFLRTLGVNCSVGPSDRAVIVPQLMMTASVRADSIAWVSCALLPIARRPRVCYEPIVTRFLQRYNMEAPDHVWALQVTINSDAERELLELLQLLSDTRMLVTVVCIEGFEVAGDGAYNATIFGCGSATHFKSVLIGMNIPAFALLHQDKAWLTADVLSILNFRILVRENVRSLFIVKAMSGMLTVDHWTFINFSASGELYIVMVVVDLILVVLNAISAVEIVALLIVPAIQHQNSAQIEEFVAGRYDTFFSRSLYRSWPIVLLSLLTQLVSWMLILPSAVIWTWGQAPGGKLHTFLSSMRVWIVVLMALNAVWDLFVRLNEALALRIVRRTYVTTNHIIVFAALGAYWTRDEVFAISDLKGTSERQRNLDGSSFTGQMAFSNTFNGELTSSSTTPLTTLILLYLPLLLIVVRSVLITLAYAGVKWVYEVVAAKRSTTQHVQVLTSVQSLPSCEDRLPLERVLRVPIRARSLVRTTMEIEMQDEDLVTTVHKSLAFDFGVLVRGDQLVARTGLRLPLLNNLLILTFFFGLDVRDLVFKLHWLGPYDAFKFAAYGYDYKEDFPLEPTFNRTNVTSGQFLPWDSGWGSFLDKCTELYTIGADGFFLHTVGINCRVSTGRDNATIPELIMTASVRADSLAWASCALLRNHRRPALCQQAIARDFYERYQMQDYAIPVEELAEPESEAEGELLQLLDVIGKSAPLYNVVCVEAIDYRGPGSYNASIFGCGSPNSFESAFVGYREKYFAVLHYDKAWLTVDDLNIMGFHFRVRENSRSLFVAELVERTEPNPASNDTQILRFWHDTDINFSCSGQLFNVLVVADIILMGYNVVSAIEIAETLIVPLFFESDPTAIESFAREGFYTFFSRSLFRSRPIAVLCVVSHMVSWMIILPNAVIWTWSLSSYGKLQAYLSSLRLWVLIVIMLNTFWDAIAYINESRALLFARKTYVTTVEVTCLGGLAAYLTRADVFSIGERKYEIEHQRLLDVTSFQDHLGFANTFNEKLDAQLNTSADVLWIIYGPLIEIVALALAEILVYLVLKLLYFEWIAYCRSRFVVGMSPVPTAPPQTTPDHGVGDDAGTVNYRTAGSRNAMTDRLPLEELVDIAIRARSIVRTSYSLEHFDDQGRCYIRPPFYFDFGIVVRNGQLQTRRGFPDIISPFVDLTQRAAACAAAPHHDNPQGDQSAVDSSAINRDATDGEDAPSTIRHRPSA